MAYVPLNQDDEEERRTSAGAPPGAFGDTTPTSNTTKTDFVNVSDYMTKNPGASAALGDLASGKLEQQKTEAQGAVDSAQSGFGQQVQSGTTNLDQGLLDNAFSAPDTFVQDSDNLGKFMAMRDATYKGPNSLQQSDVFAPTQSKVSGLMASGEGLGTEAGRTKLVEGLSTNPNKGKSALNQLLLQGNPDAAQKISNTAAGFKSVDDQWNQFVQSSPNQVTAAQNATNATRDATRAGLEQATNSFKSGLNDQLASKTNERNAFNLDYTNINNALSSGGTGLSQAQLDKLGISDAYPYITKLQAFNDPRALGYYNNPVNLSNYTWGGSANTNTPTLGGVASQQDYAREAALQQMSGMDLGLPDQQETPYTANGKLPTVDYMGAFNQGGTTLKNFDDNWSPNPLDSGRNDADQLAAIQGRRGISYDPTTGQTTGTSDDEFYTNPTVGATPYAGVGITPAPEGWDPNTPPPYPQPTTNPPSHLTNPQWNPYTGTWTGVMLQGEPTAGSGGTTSTGGRIWI